ncbi:Cdc37 N terminal kinase binding-domain-containing protein [Xylariomycetidae sp. FL0641]|nr:Cdc37 N terminal kinase binding-domain-containing protein [Xylariomycetidae sp. FL0641]
MPVDYSKWDNLELSDDSDIEVHPNVDKRSFIRAKQNQIHAERQQRRLQIETFKYERQINDGLMKRISNLLAALKSHAAEAESRNPAEVAFQAVMESAGKPEEDKPPARPEGVHAQVEQPPTYTKMMATLLDQVNQTLDEKKPENRYTAMMEEIGEHLNKVQDLQKQLLQKLAELEKEEGSKITSESIHTGFDSSFVAKSAPGEAKKDDSQVELLNPNFSMTKPDDAKGASTSESPGEDEELEASPDARKFANIKASDYRESQAFIASHPHILSEKETDGILVMAFDAQLDGKDDFARNCVHQALLLQYSRALGRDGVALFFKRINTEGHQARGVFYKDVQDTYFRIKNRAREINAERAANPSSTGDVEQIQLHAVEPGTEIKINIPAAGSEDEAERRGREIFEGFTPDMRKALETGSLDKVNEVLGKMKVPEAEEVVGLLSEAGILSLEEKIIDATTAEGRKQVKDLEEKAALESYADDPE